MESLSEHHGDNSSGTSKGAGKPAKRLVGASEIGERDAHNGRDETSANDISGLGQRRGRSGIEEDSGGSGRAEEAAKRNGEGAELVNE